MASWRSSEAEIDQVLADQNPWQADGAVPAVLAPPVERSLAGRLWRRMLDDDLRRFHLILGPRRVGKTTVMYQTVRHLVTNGIAPARLWWLRMDHPILMRESLGDLVRHIVDTCEARPGAEAVLLLDELVYAEQWDLWLKTFFDERWPVRVVATSSATATLRGRRVESGVGRWEEHFLMPYLFNEYLDLRGLSLVVDVGPSLADTLRALKPGSRTDATIHDARRRFLLIGGFPELIDNERGRDEPDADALLRSQQVLRNDAVERAIYKDIPQSFGIENPLLLERLLYLLGGQATGIVSPSAICAEFDSLSQPTFDRYVSYLEQAFLIFRLPNFAGAEAAVQRRGRKLYFHDGAVRNAALQRGLAPLADPVEMGVLLENTAAAALNTLALRSGVRLHHWREGKSEVDLVFNHPSEPLAFEIGKSARHSTSGLRAFLQRHPRFAGRAYVVAPDAPVRRPTQSREGIGTLPLDYLLVAAGRQADER